MCDEIGSPWWKREIDNCHFGWYLRCVMWIWQLCCYVESEIFMKRDNCVTKLYHWAALLFKNLRNRIQTGVSWIGLYLSIYGMYSENPATGGSHKVPTGANAHWKFIPNGESQCRQLTCFKRMGSRAGSSSSWTFSNKHGFPNLTEFSRLRRKSRSVNLIISKPASFSWWEKNRKKSDKAMRGCQRCERLQGCPKCAKGRRKYWAWIRWIGNL